MGRRANGEGSIFPYRNGYAAYVWVTTPAGQKKRKYVYGRTREEVHEKWLKLHEQARKGPVSTLVPTLAQYFAYWLAEVVVEPDYTPMTISTYRSFSEHYILPLLGSKRLDKLSARDVREWLNKIRRRCQCCAQGKDARRRDPKCCAAGKCCNQLASERTVQYALAVLRSALSNAVREELIARNAVRLVKVSKPRPRKVKPWTVEEARQFLESARRADDPLYAAYVLILVLGLRKGEVLGLPWSAVDLQRGELDVSWQLQRVGRQLLHRATKTAASDATLPLPEICITALRLHREKRKATIGREPKGSELVFLSRLGKPVDPRGFNRRFDYRARQAKVRRINVHATRRTCATLLAALDVHPRTAMQILRHSQIGVTMNVYTEVTAEDTKEALKKLGDRLSNGGSETAVS